MNEWLDDDSALHRITVWIYMDVDNTEKECCYPWKREGRRQQCMQERVNEWDSRFQMVALAKEEDRDGRVELVVVCLFFMVQIQNARMG